MLQEIKMEKTNKQLQQPSLNSSVQTTMNSSVQTTMNNGM